MKHPAALAAETILSVLAQGSAKDGRDESWREKDLMFHLSKAQAHLATHIKHLYDPRGRDQENHLHTALTRLAMALCLEEP
jgi:hypothetical protein